MPDGSALLSARPSQGVCTTPTARQVSCRLGPLGAGSTATVVLNLRATATSGTIAYDMPYTWPNFSVLPLGSTVVGTAPDPSYQNNGSLALMSVDVQKPPRKAIPVCKKGQESTKKHPCRRR